MPRSSKRLARSLIELALALSIATPNSAAGSETATLKVTLKPEHLGGRTTIAFGFHIASHNLDIPSPLTSVSIFYPRDIGLVTSGLGLETCTPSQLEALGRCSPNSLMGYGSARVELPLGTEPITEEGHLTSWMAPVEQGHLALLFYAEGQSPVKAETIFKAQLLEASAPYGGQLATTVPLIPTVPGGPNVSVTDMTSTIGPMNVTYYGQVRGKRFAYHPNGLRLPERCPHQGFPFAAQFTFLDGTQTHALTKVPCPATNKHPHH